MQASIDELLKSSAQIKMKYLYKWCNNDKRKTLYGRTCKLLVRGLANSALVEFENGQREVISRNALRKEEGNG